MTTTQGAAALLRSVGLMADGPAVWGRPVGAPGPGVFVIELAAPLATAPIELTRVGKWIERVETLRLDGERPTSKTLAARLSAFWLPVADGRSTSAPREHSVARRVAAIAATELGDRRPNSAGHWLHALRSLEGATVWWASTKADRGIRGRAARPRSPAASPRRTWPASTTARVVLPFANLRRQTGERKVTGLTGSLLAAPVVPPTPPKRVTRVADGAAEGADGKPAPAAQATGRVDDAARAADHGQDRRPRQRPRPSRPQPRPAPPVVPVPTALTAEGDARLRAELDELTRVKRPQIIARIRTAKEHGDLKENAEYHAAREEQSFLEGRVQAIEARLRSAVIVEAPVAGSRVGLGSMVTVDDDGETITYTIVGADESDPGRGPHLVVVTGRPRPGRPRHRATTWSSPRRPASAATASWRSARQVARRARDRATLVLGRLDQLVLDRVERGLRPRREPELAQDVRDVGPGGPLGDEQGRADLLVAHPLAEQVEDVLLAIGQRLDERSSGVLRLRIRWASSRATAGSRWTSPA